MTAFSRSQAYKGDRGAAYSSGPPLLYSTATPPPPWPKRYKPLHQTKVNNVTILNIINIVIQIIIIKYNIKFVAQNALSR